MSAARIAINLRSTVFGRHRRRLLVGEYIAVLTGESQISGAMRLRSLITDGLTRNGAAAHHGAYLVWQSYRGSGKCTEAVYLWWGSEARFDDEHPVLAELCCGPRNAPGRRRPICIRPRARLPFR